MLWHRFRELRTAAKEVAEVAEEWKRKEGMRHEPLFGVEGSRGFEKVVSGVSEKSDVAWRLRPKAGWGWGIDDDG